MARPKQFCLLGLSIFSSSMPTLISQIPWTGMRPLRQLEPRPWPRFKGGGRMHTLALASVAAACAPADRAPRHRGGGSKSSLHFGNFAEGHQGSEGTKRENGEKHKKKRMKNSSFCKYLLFRCFLITAIVSGAPTSEEECRNTSGIGSICS